MKVEDVIEKYIQLRDEKAIITKQMEEQLRPCSESMAKIETWLLAKLNEDGVNSFVTSTGTAFKTTQTSVSLADSTVFKRFVFGQVANSFGISVENILDLIRWDVVDFRAGKKGVQEYLEANEESPPGVNVSRATVVSVRRA